MLQTLVNACKQMMDKQMDWKMVKKWMQSVLDLDSVVGWTKANSVSISFCDKKAKETLLFHEMMGRFYFP